MSESDPFVEVVSRRPVASSVLESLPKDLRTRLPSLNSVILRIGGLESGLRGALLSSAAALFSCITPGADDEIFFAGSEAELDRWLHGIELTDVPSTQLRTQLERALVPVQSRTIRLGRHQLALGERPLLIGVINLTPRSLYGGGRYQDLEEAFDHCLEMVAAGADILELGAEALLPDASRISAKEEIQRLVPALKRFCRELPAPIAVDTYKAEVARAAVAEGAALINDNAAYPDPDMLPTLAKLDVPFVLTEPRLHVRELMPQLQRKIRRARALGVKDEQIILDPWLGWPGGPELRAQYPIQRDFELLRRVPELRSLGYPVLIAPSRKTFIGVALRVPRRERLHGTVAAAAIAAFLGADLLRVHDVREGKQAATMGWALAQGGEFDAGFAR
jgi:dihydropteroate synthase